MLPHTKKKLRQWWQIPNENCVPKFTSLALPPQFVPNIATGPDSLHSAGAQKLEGRGARPRTSYPKPPNSHPCREGKNHLVGTRFPEVFPPELGSTKKQVVTECQKRSLGGPQALDCVSCQEAAAKAAATGASLFTPLHVPNSQSIRPDTMWL